MDFLKDFKSNIELCLPFLKELRTNSIEELNDIN